MTDEIHADNIVQSIWLVLNEANDTPAIMFRSEVGAERWLANHAYADDFYVEVWGVFP